MKLEQYLNEAKIGTLYHFLSNKNLMNKVKNGFKFQGRTFGAVSFTRDYDPENVMINNPEARLVIDGNKLSKDYELQDFKFYTPTKRDPKPTDENEVRIITDGIVVNLSKYIKQIDLQNFDTSEEEEIYNQVKKNVKYPVNLVDDMKPVR